MMIIHQIWIQGWDALPKKYKKQCLRWKKINKDCFYYFWDNHSLSSLIKTKYPNLWKRYNSYGKPVLKADFGRVVILKEYGGMYVDIDTKPIHPIEKVLKLNLSKTAYIAQEYPAINFYNNYLKSQFVKFRKTANTYCLIGHNNHAFWDAMLKRMLKDKTKKGSVWSTGPWGLTEIFRKCRQKGIKVEILPMHICVPNTTYVTKDTIGIHNYDANWLPFHGFPVLRKSIQRIPLEIYFGLLILVVWFILFHKKR